MPISVSIRIFIVCACAITLLAFSGTADAQTITTPLPGGTAYSEAPVELAGDPSDSSVAEAIAMSGLPASIPNTEAGSTTGSQVPTTSQLRNAWNTFTNRIQLTRDYSERAKIYCIYYNVDPARHFNSMSAQALSSTETAFNNYRSMALRAGRWSSVRDTAIGKLNTARYYRLVARSSFESMNTDIFAAVASAAQGFTMAGKPHTHVRATAIDVLRAIRFNPEFSRSWSTLPSLYRRIAHESSGDRFAQNPSSSAYGRFQFLDSTWATVGCQKTSNGFTQSVCGLRYIKQRYGHPNNIPIGGSY